MAVCFVCSKPPDAADLVHGYWVQHKCAEVEVYAHASCLADCKYCTSCKPATMCPFRTCSLNIPCSLHECAGCKSALSIVDIPTPFCEECYKKSECFVCGAPVPDNRTDYEEDWRSHPCNGKDVLTCENCTMRHHRYSNNFCIKCYQPCKHVDPDGAPCPRYCSRDPQYHGYCPTHLPERCITCKETLHIPGSPFCATCMPKCIECGKTPECDGKFQEMWASHKCASHSGYAHKACLEERDTDAWYNEYSCSACRDVETELEDSADEDVTPRTQKRVRFHSPVVME